MDSITDEMIELCTREVGSRQTVKDAVRALSRYYGGQMMYLPKHKKESTFSEEFRSVICDEVGDAIGDTIADTLMTFFGGGTFYVPLERNAFRREIACEIFDSYDGSTDTMRDLCRKYNMSFTSVYRLWYEARKNKTQKEFDFS